MKVIADSMYLCWFYFESQRNIYSLKKKKHNTFLLFIESAVLIIMQVYHMLK